MRILVAVIVLLSVAPHVAAAQTGSAPFCLKTATGALSCSYGTMGECEQARSEISADQCITRADAAGTTGLGDRLKTPQGKPVTPPSPTER